MALIAAKRQLEWEFVFLSADETAFADAGDMGVPMASRFMFKKSGQGTARAWGLGVRQDGADAQRGERGYGL